MIPKTLRFRMRSLVIIAEKISTIIGVVTIITEAEIGEVRLNPLKKLSMFNVIPKKAEAIILGKSAQAIFSFSISWKLLIMSQIAQNKSTEPPVRMTTKP